MLHLKELRTQKGLTQSELSKALNVSASSIGMYEQGRREPDTTTLAEIAAYFNVTTDYLLGLSDHPHGEPFAGQSGKNFLDFADQPPAPAGQSGKQSTGGTEGAVSIGVATGFAKTGRKTIQAEPLTPEEEAMVRAYREADPAHQQLALDMLKAGRLTDKESVPKELSNDEKYNRIVEFLGERIDLHFERSSTNGVDDGDFIVLTANPYDGNLPVKHPLEIERLYDELLPIMNASEKQQKKLINNFIKETFSMEIAYKSDVPYVSKNVQIGLPKNTAEKIQQKRIAELKAEITSIQGKAQ